MKSKIVTRKSMVIRLSGRSSDFISPSFINECAFNCSYCYVKRHNAEYITIAKNYTDILTEVNSHALFAQVDKPNQTHDEYVTYDIGCNSDIGLHAKQLEWRYIFEYFRDHPIAMATFATKIVPEEFLSFDPKGKVRIRFSLMPENIRQILEPNTASTNKRIEAINKFKACGYDVHLNFSPVVIYDGWLEDYEELFAIVNGVVKKEYKKDVLSEVIFLTHNKKKHEYNIVNGLRGEDLLWTPEVQEDKQSTYGGENIRYKRKYKSEAIEQFKKLHNSIIPWNKIRYIF
jgi:spore photoproduct lyase